MAILAYSSAIPDALEILKYLEAKCIRHILSLKSTSLTGMAFRKVVKNNKLLVMIFKGKEFCLNLIEVTALFPHQE